MALASIDIWAILGGLAISLGLSAVLGIAVGIAEALADIRQREAELGRELEDDELEAEGERAERRMLARLRDDNTFQLGTLLASLLAQALGGYYTALWAGAAPLLNAALMGLAALALTLMFDTGDITPRWSRWAWMLLALPATLAGAFICCGAG